MKWCPSLKNDEVTDSKFQDRLGLLAVACSDGCVRILAISKKLFESSEPKMFMAKYSFTLKRSSNTSIGKYGLYLVIDWVHETHVSGFGSGKIGIY